MPKIAELRHRIDIEENTPTTGSRGTNQDVWSKKWEDVPAKIQNLSGRELELARQQVATASHKVTIRYRANVTPEHRILFKNRTLNIGHIENVEERNFWLVITTTEEK